MRNTLKTTVLLAGLAGLIMFVGRFFGGTGLWIAGVLAFVMVGGSFWFSDKLAIKSAKAIEVSEADQPKLHAMVAELAHSFELPKPRIFYSPDPQPNAFATGRSPRHAAVCVTHGLMTNLSDYEIRGVLAHELAHIDNRDILTGSVAAALATMITFIANIAYFGALFGGGGDRDRNPFAELALIMLAPVAASLIQLAISRSREYAADAEAARVLNDGEPLAGALEKLENYSLRVPSPLASASQAQKYIVHPLAGKRVTFGQLFRTHPPTELRIARLRDGSWRRAI